jgi:hypothetical protein
MGHVISSSMPSRACLNSSLPILPFFLFDATSGEVECRLRDLRGLGVRGTWESCSNVGCECISSRTRQYLRKSEMFCWKVRLSRERTTINQSNTSEWVVETNVAPVLLGDRVREGTHRQTYRRRNTKSHWKATRSSCLLAVALWWLSSSLQPVQGP